MRRCVPVAAIVVVAACRGGGDPPDRAFDRLVELVPATAMDDPAAMLQYVDLDLTWERLGVGDDPVERLDNLGRTAQVETYGIPIRLFDDRPFLVEEARAEVGFDVTDVRQEIAVDLPPAKLRIVRTDVGDDDVEAALETDPLWSDSLERVEVDAGTYFGWGADSGQDLTRITPMRPLGVGGQLAVEADGDGSVVTRTEDVDLMVESLATADGDEPSIAEDSPLAPGLDAIDEGEVVQAVGFVGALRFDPVSLPGVTPEQVERVEEVLGEMSPIRQYEAILLAEIVQDDAYRTELLVVHGDEETAAGNVEPIKTLFADGASMATQQPLSELYPVTSVEQDGVVVRITLEGEGAFRVPLQGIFQRDVLLVTD